MVISLVPMSALAEESFIGEVKFSAGTVGDPDDVATIDVPCMNVTPSADGKTITFVGKLSTDTLAGLTECPASDSSYSWADDVAFTYAYYKLPEGADYVNFGDQITVPNPSLIHLDGSTTDGQVVTIDGERYLEMVIQFAHKAKGDVWALSVGSNNPDNIVNYTFTVGSVDDVNYTAAYTYELTLDYSKLTIVDAPATSDNGHYGPTETRGEQAPTCTAEGYTGDKVCTSCGKIIEKGQVIDKTAHTYKDGKCSVCGAEDPNYKPSETEIKAPVLDPDKPVEEVTVGVVVEEKTEEMLIASASEEVQAAVNEALNTGKTVVTEVVVTKVDEKNADEETKQDIAKVEALAKEKKLEVAQYLDLSVLIKVDGTEIAKLTKLNDNLSFQIAVPEDLQKEGRIFTVVRVHDGIAKALPTTVKDGIITFETDSFSTYALTYTDNAQDGSNPDTGDNRNMMLWVVLMFVSCGGVITTTLYSNKRKADR